MTEAEIPAFPPGTVVVYTHDCTTGIGEYRPATEEELAQRAKDHAEAAARAAVEAQVQADRDALIAKFSSGKATNVELQQTVAKLMGR